MIRFLIQNIYTVGGTIRSVANLSNYLVEQGYEVEIISIRRTCDMPKLQLNKNIRITTLYDARENKSIPQTNSWFKKKLQQKRMNQSSRIIDKTEDKYLDFNRHIDHLLLHALKNIKDGILVTTIPSLNMLSVKYTGKHVIRIGQEHKGLQQHSESIQKMIQTYYGRLDALTILTKQNLEKYRNLIQYASLSITVLGNGLEMFHIPAPLDNKVIISAGRFVESKRFDLLIDAFSKIADRYPDWCLKIFGTGEFRDELVTKILANGLENQIFLCPNTKQMLTELSKASLFAFTSQEEGFGMVLVEAMSVGLPCIAFDCDGPHEIITHEIDGFLIPLGETTEFAKKLEALMKNKELRKVMGRRAIKNVERYSIKRIGHNFEDLFQKLLETKM